MKLEKILQDNVKSIVLNMVYNCPCYYLEIPIKLGNGARAVFFIKNNKFYFRKNLKESFEVTGSIREFFNKEYEAELAIYELIFANRSQFEQEFVKAVKAKKELYDIG